MFDEIMRHHLAKSTSKWLYKVRILSVSHALLYISLPKAYDQIGNGPGDSGSYHSTSMISLSIRLKVSLGFLSRVGLMSVMQYQ